MGQLLFEKDITNPPWYFEDAWYSSEDRRFIFPWPNQAYPHTVAMHENAVMANKSKPTIRRWIEQNLQETVIYSVVDNSYRKFYGKDHSYQSGYEKRNIWLVFYFDNEHSAAMFKLAFADLARPITKHHPEYPEDEEWCNKTPGERVS